MKDELTQFFIEKLGVDPNKLNSETLLVADLNLDSIDMLDLVVMLNSKIGKNLALKDFEGVKTFGELVARIDETTSKLK